MCFWWLCCPPRRRINNDSNVDHDSLTTGLPAADPQDLQDYEDLLFLARKREIRVTIRKSTQAGVAAGLSVMAGTIVAGPAGALVGGAFGTALAASISKNVVSLNDLLAETPPHQRHEVVHIFRESFKEEFMGTINDNPELRLLLGGMSIVGVMRYMVDRDLLQNEQLVRLDTVLRKVA